MAKVQDDIKVKGMFRVKITEDGKVVGDSGWKKNLVVNLGFNNIVNLLGTSLTGSKLSHMAVGTGAAPGATDTTLSGEQSVRAALIAATSSSSKTLRCTATFDSTASFVTATKNLSNIALCCTSTAGAATILAGNTYASSAVATNQNVNATYDVLLA